MSHATQYTYQSTYPSFDLCFISDTADLVLERKRSTVTNTPDTSAMLCLPAHLEWDVPGFMDKRLKIPSDRAKMFTGDNHPSRSSRRHNYAQVVCHQGR
jgi:hypothetical protein